MRKHERLCLKRTLVGTISSEACLRTRQERSTTSP